MGDPASKLARDPRVTRIGRVLRTTSLDELPQLVNVLLGQMSLVGPRPVVREELEQHYGLGGAAAYAATRPGITGLWQVSGRSTTSYHERVRLDIAYTRTWSLLLDLKIRRQPWRGAWFWRHNDLITWDDYRRDEEEFTLGLLSQISPTDATW